MGPSSEAPVEDELLELELLELELELELLELELELELELLELELELELELLELELLELELLESDELSESPEFSVSVELDELGFPPVVSPEVLVGVDDEVPIVVVSSGSDEVESLVGSDVDDVLKLVVTAVSVSMGIGVPVAADVSVGPDVVELGDVASTNTSPHPASINRPAIAAAHFKPTSNVQSVRAPWVVPLHQIGVS